MIKALAITALLLLSGCGGSTDEAPATPPEPVRVSFYGDSITSGASNTEIAGVFEWLKPSPVQRMNEYAAGAFVGTDYAHNGATALDARDGADGMPFTTFADALKADKSPVVVIRYATASALRMPGGVAEYGQALRDLVALAQGRTVVLVGSPHISGLPQTWDDLALFEAETQRIAQESGAAFISLSRVAGPDTPDGVHPSREYSDRISAEIVTLLREMLNLARPEAGFTQKDGNT